MRCNLGVLKLYVKTIVEVPLAGIITQKESLQKLALSLQSSHDILHCVMQRLIMLGYSTG